MPIGDGMIGNLKGINSELQDTIKYLKEAKDLTADIGKNTKAVKFTNGGTGNSGNKAMSTNGVNSANPSAGASMGGATSKASWLGQAALGVGKVITAGASMMGSMLPDTTQVIQTGTRYYNASLGQAGVTRRLMTGATFSAMQGGLTGIGNDSMLAMGLSRAGIAFSNQPGSQYMSTLAGVSNAAKYLNMSNESAMSAITGLKTGSMSATMMRNFGVQTSDWTTGKTLSQGQIFDQLAQRMQNPGMKLTTENIMSSYQRGFLGANLKSSGLSEDQQQLFVQYMLEKSQGNNLDLENNASMQQLIEKKNANNDLNPAQAGYNINTSETKLQNTVTDNYIKGQQQAVEKIQSFNDILAKTPDWMQQTKAEWDTMMGSKGISGAVDSASTALSGFADALLGIIGLMTSIAASGAGGGTTMVDANGKPIKGKSATAGKMKAGAKAGAAGGTIASLAIGGAVTASDIASGADSEAIGGDIGGTAGGILGSILGGAVGSLLGPAGTVIGATLGGYAGSWLGGQAGSAIGKNINSSNTQKAGGAGGVTPGLGTSTAAASASTPLTFIKPVNGPYTDRFGPRAVNYGDGGFHNGLDIRAPTGTPIAASADGVVIAVSSESLGGNYVKIKHSNGYTTGYFHQSSQATATGKTVKQGEQIGFVGQTGAATGPHLHFTVQDATGSYIDPERVLAGGGGGVTSVGTQTGNPVTDNSTGTQFGSASAAPLNSIIDMRAKTDSKHVQSLRMADGAAPTNVLTNKTQRSGSTGTISGGRESMGLYDPSAPRAKDGDPYVAQDGPVNVHAGEAILTSEQADEWRAGQSGRGGRGGNNVTIHLTVASASDDEARRFAKIVKGYLEEDNLVGRMGRN